MKFVREFLLAWLGAVSAREHSDLMSKYLELSTAYQSLSKDWNAMVTAGNDLKRRYDAMCSIKNLAEAGRKKPQLTKSEVRTLIKLCHPDKHASSEEANAITRRLLELR